MDISVRWNFYRGGAVGFFPEYRDMDIFMSLLVIQNFDIGIITLRALFSSEIVLSVKFWQ